jgi:hypothetical protein
MRRAVVVLLLLTARARADEDMTGLDDREQAMARSLNGEARPHFVLGYKAFNNKDYKTAIAEFEIAYRLDPEVPLLFTWAQAERLGGNCKRALELYQKYLYSEINREQAAFTRERIKECGGVAKAPIVVAPPPPPHEESPHYVWYKDVPADALTGAGAIAVIAGIVYFAKASNSGSAADSAFYLDEHDHLRDTAIHQRNIGLGATIAGVVVAGAGVGLYVYHARNAAVTTDGQSVAVALRW